MSATAHPGKTPAQRRVLDQIGCGNYSPIMAARTRDALLNLYLIEELDPHFVKDRFGVMKIRQFQMPIPVHMQWCAAVAEEDTSHAPD